MSDHCMCISDPCAYCAKLEADMRIALAEANAKLARVEALCDPDADHVMPRDEALYTLAAEVLALRAELAEAEAQALAADTHSVNVKAEYEEHRRRLDALQRPPRHSTEAVDAFLDAFDAYVAGAPGSEWVALNDAVRAVRASREPKL